jgi:hypothetical protein
VARRALRIDIHLSQLVRRMLWLLGGSGSRVYQGWQCRRIWWVCGMRLACWKLRWWTNNVWRDSEGCCDVLDNECWLMRMWWGMIDGRQPLLLYSQFLDFATLSSWYCTATLSSWCCAPTVWSFTPSRIQYLLK